MSENYLKAIDKIPLEIQLKVAFQMHDYTNWDNGEYKGDAEKYVPIAIEIFNNLNKQDMSEWLKERLRANKLTEEKRLNKQSVNQEWKYCPYCGEKLEYKVPTDINSGKHCTTSTIICKRND